MRKLIPFLLLFSSLVQANTFIVRQDQKGGESQVHFEMLQTADGYTPITGIVPVCTVKRPLGTAYASSINTVTEIGNGTYALVLAGEEIQNTGVLSIYCTGTGARAKHFKSTIIGSGSMWADGASLMTSNSNFNNTTYWTKSGVTVTEDSTADYIAQTIGDTITGDGANTAHKITYATIQAPGGLRELYSTVEAKTGSLNNIWVGDPGWGIGIDLNTSSGAVATTANGYLRGWKIEKLGSSYWRIHLKYNVPPTDASALTYVVALGNGTVGTAPPVFTTSGTMIAVRAHIMRAEDVSPALIADVLPTVASASSSTVVVLDGNEPTSSDVMKNREICFIPAYVGTVQQKAFTICSCISSYDGSTKTATLNQSTYTTLSSNYKYRIGGTCTFNVNVASISAGAVSNSAIATNAIDNTKFSDNSIGPLEIATDTITAAKIAASAITSSEFAQSAADKTWNTAPQDGSASTALGYLDAIKKYVSNKMSIVGSNYTIYKDDQTTSYATGTTNSAGRDPD